MSSSLAKSKAQPLSALAQMPVKEVTAFKDGHAFVLHEGSMPTDNEGNVSMDYLPTPVLGTFWTFCSDKDAKLSSVVASQRRVLVPRTALCVREFIEANPGAEVQVTESRNAGSNNASTFTYDAQIMGIPVRSSEELESTSPPNGGEKLPVYGDCVLLKNNLGTATVPLSKIEYITFKSGYQSKLSNQEFRNLLSLKLDWNKGQNGKSADVGMMYLQKGIRWIPQYKVNIDGNGKARLRLQATITNDLCDLNDVTMNLVVGVPSFSFKDEVDPISLQNTLAHVSARVQSNYGNRLSNAIMTQTAGRFDESNLDAAGESPEVSGTARNEDLFVFTVKHLSLRKGQRMTMPVYDCELKYKDIYTLTLPFSPPPEIVQHFNHNQQSEIERMMQSPKFMHKIRLENKSEYPLTTAPALLMKNDKLIAQGLMTYTAVGASSDISLTTAVDLKINKQDKETQRVANAVTWQGDQYGRVDLAGKISCSNYGPEPAEIEVVRYVLGKTGAADHDGKCEMVNIFEDYDFLPDGGGKQLPFWWGWYSWPNWWSRFNGVGKISWHYNLKAKETLDLNYNWSYFWR